MKRPILTTCIAVAAAAALFASTDRIILNYKNGKTAKIWIEDVNSMKFGKSDPAIEGYDRIVVDSNDGNTSETSLDRLKSTEYRHGLEDSRITMTLKPHHRSVSMFIEAPEGVYFRNGAIPLKRLKDIPEREWIDVIYDTENAILNEVADYYGRPLSDFSNESVFRKGSGQIDWFPQGENEDVEMPGTDYIAYVYEGNVGPNGLEFLRDPYIVPFTAKKLELLDIDFDFNIDSRSNRATVTLNAPENCETEFAIDIVEKIKFDAYGLDRCIKSSIDGLMQQVYIIGKKWDEVLFSNGDEKLFSPLNPDEEYVILAYGCEYGEQTTAAITKTFRLSAPEITDNCTFSMENTQLSASEINIKVTPSNQSTRWVSMIKRSDYFEDHDIESYVASHLYYYTVNRLIDWTSSEYIHTGDATLNSKNDVIDGLYLDIDTDYTLMVFGIDNTGERTTAISKQTLRTTSTQNKIDFEVEIGKYDNSGSTHWLPIKVTPSDLNAKYVLTTVTDDGVWTELESDDIMRDFVRMEGKNLSLKSGIYDSRLGFYPMGRDILIFLFGYDGEPTSALNMWRVNCDSGIVTKLRGPEM